MEANLSSFLGSWDSVKALTLVCPLHLYMYICMIDAIHRECLQFSVAVA